MDNAYAPPSSQTEAAISDRQKPPAARKARLLFYPLGSLLVLSGIIGFTNFMLMPEHRLNRLSVLELLLSAGTSLLHAGMGISLIVAGAWAVSRTAKAGELARNVALVRAASGVFLAMSSLLLSDSAGATQAVRTGGFGGLIMGLVTNFAIAGAIHAVGTWLGDLAEPSSPSSNTAS